MAYSLNHADINCTESIEHSLLNRLKNVTLALFNKYDSKALIKAPSIMIDANIKVRTEGLSGDSVFELVFKDTNSQAALNRYIFKVFDSREKMEKEKKIFDVVSNIGNEYFSGEIIEHDIKDELILVVRHAASQTGSEMLPLHILLERLLEAPEKLLCDRLCEEIKSAGKNILDFYKNAAQLLDMPHNTLMNSVSYINSISYKFPPDVVLDLGRHECKWYESSRTSSLQFTDIANNWPGSKNIDTSKYDFKSFMNAGDSSITKWKTFSRHAFCGEIKGDYQVLQEIDDKQQRIKIWAKFPNNISCEELYKSRELILLPEKDVILRGVEVLETLGLSNKASCLYDDTLDETMDFLLEILHSDLHCDNFLVSENGKRIKVLDFGTPEYSLPGTMSARLETSLWKKLDRTLEYHQIGTDITEILSSIETDSNPIFSDDPISYVLINVFKAIRNGFLGSKNHRRTSYIIQVHNFQRNIIKNTEKCFSCFNAFVESVFDSFKNSSNFIIPSSVQLNSDDILFDSNAITVKSLWYKAFDKFGDSDVPQLRQEEQVFLTQLERTSPRLFHSRLTDLQQIVYNYSKNVFAANEHIVLSGPTSSGKSTLIELFMTYAARINTFRKCAVYIAPTRSLTRAKFLEFKERFKNTDIESSILFSTGEERDDDWKIQHGKFSIACMVYEKANMLLSQNNRLVDKLGCVVVDELHMLMDIERGPILELALTKLKEHRQNQTIEERTHSEDSLRIICVTTESGSFKGVQAFLNADKIPPLFFESTIRPVEVTHNLLLPGRDSDILTCTVEVITTFEGNASRQLSHASIMNLSNRLSKYRWKNSARYSHDEACFSNFIKNKLEAHPKGYRSLVFVPGKEEAMHFAGRLKNLRKSRSRNDSISSFISKLANSEDPKARLLIELAKNNIFVHHADLEKEIRNEIEDIAGYIDPNADSQVLFCTETLSYGVNLAINDVFIYGIDFWSQTRKRIPTQMPLSSHSFHNMAGRAGRLGKQGEIGNNAYIVVRSGVDPDRIIKLYYGSTDSTHSKIYVGEDKSVYSNKINNFFYETLRADLETEDSECPGFESISATDFTYPFARSVLDVLRYLNNRINSENLSPNTAEEVINFLGKTLCGIEAKNKMTSQDLKIFICSIKAILKDCSKDNLGLVRTDRDKSMFMISERGQSIIDTGTQLDTVAPAWKLIRSFHKAWNNIENNKIRFPCELYLLIILSVPEICRKYLMNTPECKGDTTWSDDVIEMNRKNVLTLFESKCEAYLAINNSSFINAIVTSIETDSEVYTPQTHYGGDNDRAGRADGIIRTFCSLLAWINFEPQTDVINIFEKSANLQVNGNFSNFRNLLEILNWRMLFLNILLETSPDPAVKYNYEDARNLNNIADRIRLGCTDEAIPLFWPTRESRIKRVQAKKLMQDDLTPCKLLKITHTDTALNSISAEQLSKLVKDIGRYAGEQYEMLVNQIGTNTSRQDTEDRSKVYEILSATPEFFTSAIETYRRGTKNPSGIFSKYLKESLAVIEPNYFFSSRETWHGDKFRLKNGNTDENLCLIAQKLQGGLEDSLKLTVVEETFWNVVGLHIAHDDMCYVETDKRVHIKSILQDRKDDPNLIFITIPWLSNGVNESIQEILNERKRNGHATHFITLPCFVLLLGLLTKNYTSGIEFFTLLENRQSDILSVVGVQEFYDFYKKNNGQKLVPAIEEKLIGYFEVV